MCEAPRERFLRALTDVSEQFAGQSMNAVIRHVREAELSMTQLGALMHINRQGHCGVSGVGSHMGISAPAASQMLDRLVEQGLVEREEDPDDRRARRLALTDAGKAELESAIQARRAWHRSLAAALGHAEQVNAAVVLEMLADRMRTLEEE